MAFAVLAFSFKIAPGRGFVLESLVYVDWASSSRSPVWEGWHPAGHREAFVPRSSFNLGRS